MKSEIIFKNCQIKSIEKLYMVEHCLDTLEKEIGIKSVKITFEGVFICPDVIEELKHRKFGSTPMQKILSELIYEQSKTKI